jgi:hypothetical protein
VATSSRIKWPKRRVNALNRKRHADAAKLVQGGNRTLVFDLQESSSSLPNRQRGKWMWKLKRTRNQSPDPAWDYSKQEKEMRIVDDEEVLATIAKYSGRCILCGLSGSAPLITYHLKETGLGDQTVTLCNDCSKRFEQVRQVLSRKTSPTRDILKIA